MRALVVAFACLVVAPRAVPAQGDVPGQLLERKTATDILAAQPAGIRERVLQEHLVVMSEVREEGSLSGGIIMAFVVFQHPPSRVYRFLSQTARQIEFRPELTSIETLEWVGDGPLDEQRLKILFQRYVYRLQYHLDPEKRIIRWELDPSFDNDLDQIDGYWELYDMDDGRTLGRFGTSIDIGPTVPGFLQDWVTRKNLPATMKRCRLWVDSGGTYRP